MYRTKVIVLSLLYLFLIVLVGCSDYSSESVSYSHVRSEYKAIIESGDNIYYVCNVQLSSSMREGYNEGIFKVGDYGQISLLKSFEIGDRYRYYTFIHGDFLYELADGIKKYDLRSDDIDGSCEYVK